MSTSSLESMGTTMSTSSLESMGTTATCESAGTPPPAAAATGGEDRISALPDDVLHLLLSRLPSDEAACTSVLARRWTHLWMSARAIRVGPRVRHEVSGWTQRTLTRFVNHLLLLRGHSPVDECDISCGEVGEDEDYYYDSSNQMSACISRRCAAENLSDAAGLWIRHAVSFCKVKALKFSVRTINRLRIPDVPFVSEKLTKVEIAQAQLTFDTLDFSRCPALEVLEFSRSRIEVGTVRSPSLRRLSMDECNFTGETRTRISTPHLVSLHLLISSGCAPFLDEMPMLVVAHVRICDGSSSDVCRRRESQNWDCDREGCYECKGVGDGSSVIFQGLSGATDLELTSDPRVVCACSISHLLQIRARLLLLFTIPGSPFRFEKLLPFCQALLRILIIQSFN